MVLESSEITFLKIYNKFGIEKLTKSNIKDDVKKQLVEKIKKKWYNKSKILELETNFLSYMEKFNEENIKLKGLIEERSNEDINLFYLKNKKKYDFYLLEAFFTKRVKNKSTSSHWDVDINECYNSSLKDEFKRIFSDVNARFIKILENKINEDKFKIQNKMTKVTQSPDNDRLKYIFFFKSIYDKTKKWSDVLNSQIKTIKENKLTIKENELAIEKTKDDIKKSKDKLKKAKKSIEELKKKSNEIEQKKKNENIKLNEIKKKISEKKNLEINIKKIKEEKKNVEERLEEKKETEKKINLEIKEKEKKMKEITEKINKTKKLFEVLMSGGKKKNIERKELKKQLKAINNRIKKNKTEEDKMIKSITEKKKKLKKLNQRIKLINDKTLEDAQIKEYEGKIKTLKVEITNLKNKLKECVKLKTQLNDYKTQQENQEKKNKEVMNQLRDKFKLDRKKLEDQLVQINIQKSKLETRKKLQKKNNELLSELKTKNELLKENNDLRSKTKNKLQKENNDLRSKINELKNNRANLLLGGL